MQVWDMADLADALWICDVDFARSMAEGREYDRVQREAERNV